MSTSVDAVVTELRACFAQHANAGRAPAMAAYMRDQFPFYGIDAITRRTLLREVQRKLGLPSDVLALAESLWQCDERELQYVACDVLTQPRVLRILDAGALPHLVALVTQKSWWDTVDCLAPNIIGHILRPLPSLAATLAEEWIEADDIWLQRTAIIMQLRYHEHTNEALLFACIERRASSTEFFVRKGAGWALRQYAYTAPDRVRDFVEARRNVLSGLTIREALKHQR